MNSIKLAKYSDWKCHLFGSDPKSNSGLVYNPVEGSVPNWFVRRMMKLCFGCTWVKEKEIHDMPILMKVLATSSFLATSAFKAKLVNDEHRKERREPCKN